MKRRSLNKLYSIKFKNQSSKLQLKTLKLSSCYHPDSLFVILRAQPEGSLNRMSND